MCSTVCVVLFTSLGVGGVEGKKYLSVIKMYNVPTVVKVCEFFNGTRHFLILKAFCVYFHSCQASWL